MEPFIGQIMLIGFNFPPRGWALCDGQLLLISQHQALFSLLGTTYGGDGETTFGLPDLRGRAPIHVGSGPGLTPRRIGQKGGSETTILTANNLPPHSHSFSGSASLKASSTLGDEDTPTGNYPAANSTDEDFAAAADSTMAADAAPVSGTIGVTGGGQAVDNMQPFLAMNYIIALQGIFPSPS
ncbi:phage tail protein [Roseibacillus ishigakijimensis]|uniref:Phage tail protein n=1 Tax=Roseibacillus ishigakijimensis TaxID=454146 RepID=A0A934VKW6_9BACT|nr:tail fiber protein [Roseibacillus ishigakijimensis]MBK1832607.1 phage tail protein [Roseibacillus ishigakijimensis]